MADRLNNLEAIPASSTKNTEAEQSASSANALRDELGISSGQPGKAPAKPEPSLPGSAGVPPASDGKPEPGTGTAKAGSEEPHLDPPVDLSQSTNKTTLTPSEQRQAEERDRFTKLYQQKNVAIEPLQDGWGPFQALQQMVKEHKLNLTDDQVLSEARRIRDRDFGESGIKYYDKNDQPMFWSEKEIAKKVEDTVNRVKGIDVSSYQHTIDWKQVKDAGYQFAFLKASEGVDYVDPTFATNRAGALEAGIKVGYYHYFRPNDPVDEQVKNFVDTVGKVDPNSVRLVIDAEDPSMWKPYTVRQRVNMIDEWCQGVKKALGVTPQVSVYSSPNFVKEVLNNSPKLGKYSLWIANYNVAEPTLPKPWSKWDFWQYSDNGNVPGITGGVDLDMYREDSLSKDSSQKKQHKCENKSTKQ